jgi:Uma2 family endonuclease
MLNTDKRQQEAIMVTTTTRYRFTADDLGRLDAASLFPPEARVELLDGVIYTMSPIGIPHVRAILRLTMELSTQVIPLGYLVSVQNPLWLGAYDLPQPDIAIVPASAAEDRPSDAVLVIEVSDTTLRFDRGAKARRYAVGGVPEYWIVNLLARQVEWFRNPGPNGDQRHGVVRTGTLAAEHLAIGIDVDALFR